MISFKEAKKEFNKKYPDRVISRAFKHDNGYLFVASKKGIDPMFDYSDPYFLVNKDDGSVIGYLPSEHFDEMSSLYENELEI